MRKDGVGCELDGIAHRQYDRQDDGGGPHKEDPSIASICPRQTILTGIVQNLDAGRPYQNEPIWSRSEKVIARKAFDAALGRELHEVMQEAKKIASQIQQRSDLWDLEHYLTRHRKEIDRKYDYRSSRLTQVF
jgi:hypothetical protein